MTVEEITCAISSSRDFKVCQKYFLKEPDKLQELLKLIKTKREYPLKEYASWIFVHLCETQTEEVQPFLNNFIDILFKTSNQTVLRNTLNTIKQLKKNDYRESEFIDLMIKFIQDSSNKVALQVYSMQVLVHYIQKYPEIKNEIIEIVDLNAEGKTAAYFSAQRSFLKNLKRVK